MLHHLRGVLGDDQFFEDARDFCQTYKGESIETAEFRSFWKERLGPEGIRWMCGSIPLKACTSWSRDRQFPRLGERKCYPCVGPSTHLWRDG